MKVAGSPLVVMDAALFRQVAALYNAHQFRRLAAVFTRWARQCRRAAAAMARANERAPKRLKDETLTLN
jgi:hypothetical protein